MLSCNTDYSSSDFNQLINSWCYFSVLIENVLHFPLGNATSYRKIKKMKQSSYNVTCETRLEIVVTLRSVRHRTKKTKAVQENLKKKTIVGVLMHILVFPNE
jgi:hypothetical protein